MSLSLPLSQSNALTVSHLPLHAVPSQPAGNGSAQQREAAAPASQRPASQRQSASVQIPPTPTAVSQSRPSRGHRASTQTQLERSPDVTGEHSHHAAAASSAAVPAAHSSAAHADRLERARKIAAASTPIEDHSNSFLARFSFPPTDGPPREIGGKFMVWTHHTPVGDALECILMQTSPLPRIYICRTILSDLKPVGLYMAGMKDEVYKWYVLNGLKAQDEANTSFEYEFTTAGAEEDGGAVVAPTILNAQLRLYKQMGDTTRVPVCIAHLKFDPVRLEDGALNPTEARQSPQQYKANYSQLLSSLCKHHSLQQLRRHKHEEVLKRQGQEEKQAEELLANLPPNGGDVVASGHALLRRMVQVLNDKKSILRERRKEVEDIAAQVNALLPKPARGGVGGAGGGAPDDDALSFSSSEEDASSHGELSESDDENPMMPPLVDPQGEYSQNVDDPLVPSKEAIEAEANSRDHDVDMVEIAKDRKPPMRLQPSRATLNASVHSPPLGSSTLPPPTSRQVSSNTLDSSASIPIGSIDPVSIGGAAGGAGTYDMSFALSSPSFPDGYAQASPGSGGGSGRRRTASRPATTAAAAAAAAPSIPSADMDFSPPRAKAMVRKRARPLPAAHSPSSGSQSASQYPPSNSYGQGAPARKASAPTAAPVHANSKPNAAGRSSRDASQVMRDLASNATSRKQVAGGGALSNEPQQSEVEPEQASAKRQRTQGSMHTSRVIGDMD